MIRLQYINNFKRNEMCQIGNFPVIDPIEANHNYTSPKTLTKTQRF